MAKGYDDEEDDEDRQRRRAEDDEAGREGVGDEDDVVDECVCDGSCQAVSEMSLELCWATAIEGEGGREEAPSYPLPCSLLLSRAHALQVNTAQETADVFGA